MNWAVDHSYIQANHLAGMSNLYSVDRSGIAWTPDELDRFLYGDAADGLDPAPHWLQRLMISATETGLRPGDLRILSRQHITTTREGRRIFMRTAKRKRIVSIPVTRRMAVVVDATPITQLCIVVGGNGKPFAQTPSLGQAVSRRRDACGIRADQPVDMRPRLQDARGTAATRLFEADATLREIATHMGWSIGHTSQMIETYVALSPDASDSLLLKLKSGA